jgi:hypothetical protein
MKEHLQAFEIYRKEKITFDSFDLDFYESFIDYLSFHYVQRRRKKVIQGLKVNIIGKTIKQLRIFLRNRMRKKIIPQIDPRHAVGPFLQCTSAKPSLQRQRPNHQLI